MNEYDLFTLWLTGALGIVFGTLAVNSFSKMTDLGVSLLADLIEWYMGYEYDSTPAVQNPILIEPTRRTTMPGYGRRLKWRGAEERKAAQVAEFAKSYKETRGFLPTLRAIGEKFERSTTWAGHYLKVASDIGILEV